MDGGPASRAGLQVGDVIEGLGGSRVKQAHALRWQVESRGVGRSVVLRVRRGTRPLKLRVKLEPLPQGERVVPAVATPSRPSDKEPGTGTGGSGLEGQADEQAPGENAPSP